jgi:S1-C subfamily serine protease
MRDICTERELGPNAISYVKDCLADGNSLAKLLMQSHDLNNGRVTTYLPAEVSDEVAEEFRTGGKLPASSTRSPPGEVKSSAKRLEPLPTTDSCLAGEIHEFLNLNEEHLCVFEDSSASPSDPFLQSLDTCYSVMGDEVYHFILSTDAGDEKILRTIRRARSWLFIGVMSSASLKSGFFSRSGTLTISELKVIAEHAEKILVGAYDGESYLIWSRA